MFVDFIIKSAKGALIAQTPSNARWVITPFTLAVRLPSDLPDTSDIYATKSGIAVKVGDKWKLYGYGKKGIVELPSNIFDSILSKYSKDYEFDRVYVTIGAGIDGEESFNDLKDIRLHGRMPCNLFDDRDFIHFSPPTVTNKKPYVYVNVHASASNGYVNVSMRRPVDNKCVPLDEAVAMLKEGKGEIFVDDNLGDNIKRTVVTTPDSDSKFEVFVDISKGLIHVVPEIVLPTGTSMVNFRYKHDGLQLLGTFDKELNVRIDKGLVPEAGTNHLVFGNDELMELDKETRNLVDFYNLMHDSHMLKNKSIRTIVASIPYAILHTIPFAVTNDKDRWRVYFIAPEEEDGVAASIRTSDISKKEVSDIRQIKGYISKSYAFQYGSQLSSDYSGDEYLSEESMDVFLQVASVFAVSDKGKVFITGNAPIPKYINGKPRKRFGDISSDVNSVDEMELLVMDEFYPFEELKEIGDGVEQIDVVNVGDDGIGDFVIFAKLKNGKGRMMWNLSYSRFGSDKDRVGAQDIDIETKNKNMYIMLSNDSPHQYFMQFLNSKNVPLPDRLTYPIAFTNEKDKTEIYPFLLYIPYVRSRTDELDSIQMDKVTEVPMGILFKPFIVTGDGDFGLYLSIVDIKGMKNFINVVCG